MQVTAFGAMRHNVIQRVDETRTVSASARLTIRMWQTDDLMLVRSRAGVILCRLTVSKSHATSTTELKFSIPVIL